jgi:hypothetical protein
LIHERHRHRYEFNNRYREILKKYGLGLSGICEERDLVEMVEIPDHPWFVGCQFHPEFKSKPMAPHPLFTHFIEAALQQSLGKKKNTKVSLKVPAKVVSAKVQKNGKKVTATGKKAREFFAGDTMGRNK